MTYRLKEISPNRFRFTGSKELLMRKYKAVEVDGEIYSRMSGCFEVVPAEQLYDEAYCIDEYEYNFDVLEINVSIEFPAMGGRVFNGGWSTNDYADYILQAFNSGLLDKRIKRLYTSKDPLDSFNKYHVRERYKYPTDAYRDCIFFRHAPIALEKYGFNNCIFYEVGTVSFLKSKYENIPNHILNWLIDENIFNSRKNIKTNTYNLLTKKLSYYENS